MKVLETYIFKYTDFKDIPILKKAIMGKDPYEKNTPEVYLTTNDYPNFHVVVLYKVQNNFIEYYIKRPTHKTSSSFGSTTYHEKMIKIDVSTVEKLYELLKVLRK